MVYDIVHPTRMEYQDQMITFQEILRRMSQFWEKQGCIIHQGYDLEVGAGTFNPATFLRCLGPEPYYAAYIEPSRRPSDGRYGQNPNRLQHYFQYQAVLKPSPPNIQQLYLQSLEAIGFCLADHDIRFVHDDWESPTLGASGLGWEVWMDGMEVTQFTYFQNFAGIALKPVTGEITYGIERLAMYLQGVDSIFDLQWSEHLKYGDIYHRNEVEWSHYNFEYASTAMWLRHFEDFEQESKMLIEKGLSLPAYDFVMKASHAFNILDARGAISVTERARYIARVREMACLVAATYLKNREQQGFPLLRLKHYQPTVLPETPLLPTSLAKETLGQTADFLLEIGSEELPATFVPIGCTHLEKAMTKLLKEEEIPYHSLAVYGTPRRLAIAIIGLATEKPPQQQESKGPPVNFAFHDDGSPKESALGFFRTQGIPPLTLEEIKSGKYPNVSIRPVKNIDYLFATIEKPSVLTAKILQEKLPALILHLEFPKRMRWSDLEISYARPLRWILCLFGNQVIPFVVGALTSSRESQGHPQLSPGIFTIEKPSDYLDALRNRKVLADIVERRESIENQLHSLEKQLGLKTLAHEAVIPQVLHLVEWPVCTVATFKETFLRVPKEVLISEMVEHQKYFPLANHAGHLVPKFVITADTEPTDAIRHGNEKVISARLSDGVFLYEKGLRMSLDEWNEKLKQMTFQKGLGSVYHKMERLVSHALYLQSVLGIAEPKQVERAAFLCKGDLATEMVFEFPELQGIIGHNYALTQGEEPEVALAIEEHWMPRGENAPLPQTPIGIILSLSDRIDNLISCFGLGFKPSSSSDPYALRRQLLGIIKLLIREKIRLPILETFRTCLRHFPEEFKKKEDLIVNDIAAFIVNRVKTVFVDFGLEYDEIEASLSTGITDIYDMYEKVEALHAFRSNRDSFNRLMEVYKRARGQLANQSVAPLVPELLKEPSEVELYSQLCEIEPLFSDSIRKHDYIAAYAHIAAIQPGIAKLFDEVKILADDPTIRNNRLALLKKLFDLFEMLVDFSCILQNYVEKSQPQAIKDNEKCHANIGKNS